MSERTLGYLLVLCAVALWVVWTIDLSNMIRFGVTGLLILGVVIWAIRALHSKSKLKVYRNSQIEAHANKN